MGIDPHHALLIIREHAYRPLPETVHMIGRQTVRLTPDRMMELCRSCGVTPENITPRFDRETRLAKQTGATDYITDETFFKMLGVENILAIDHSDYEGADIILDLNKPIPEEYHETVDFVFGGSVCDNVFDPAMYLRNISALLKKGGIFIDQNIITDHYHPYAILPPAWYFDFFVLNQYSDCKIYVIECAATMNIYGLDVGKKFSNIWNFPARDAATANGILVIAEKGENSTNDRTPIQDQYRGKEEWGTYRKNLKKILKAPRRYQTFTKKDAYMMAASPPLNAKNYKFLGMMWRCF